MLWKREYLYWTYPDLPVKDGHQIERLLQETNFEHRDAKTFKAGWDHCIHCAGEAVSLAINEVAE